MILMKRLMLFTALLVLSFNTFAAEPDWSAYAEALKSVSPGTKNDVKLALVDYQVLKENGKLEAAYQQLSSFPVKNLSNKKEKLAFYINAYNILALKMVVDHWPLDSIKDVGSLISPVWGKSAGSIDGETVSLDDIENKILRPLGEPRIHFAIVCASVSCPDLRNTPYTASNLNAQLDEQIQQFLSNADKGLRIGDESIQISRIFDWFGKDFKPVGGVEAFIRRYRSDLPQLPFKESINYDWDVNGITAK
ncbi:DUF547 domain-containing protein [Methylobacter svalbardensis]|uniref:DUF547 domain-containing protein n=1 Tax=Methylobacter svalbardensis TaxID=3080016 RepID=UPI0030EDEF4F